MGGPIRGVGGDLFQSLAFSSKVSSIDDIIFSIH